MKITKEDLNKVLIDVKSEETVQELADMNYKKYLNSEYWSLVRKSMHEITGNKCEICGGSESLNIHHLSYENRGKETLDDLVCLCQRCHEVMHTYESPFIGHISDRKTFEKQVKLANKIKKKFNNKRFLKVLPLTQQGSWEIEQLQNLFECTADEVRGHYVEELKDKLVVKNIGRTGTTNFEFYTLNRFIWNIIKFDFPKVGD